MKSCNAECYNYDCPLNSFGELELDLDPSITYEDMSNVCSEWWPVDYSDPLDVEFDLDF